MAADKISSLDPALERIRQNADAIDLSGDWPEEDLLTLAQAGWMRRSLPVASGGEASSALELNLGYESLARASLTLALIVSQRDSAIALIEASEQLPLRAEVLSRLARNDAFTTIGIAQLTTSRQGGVPALRAIRTEGSYRLDGFIPWSTGAAKSDWVVAGASLEDGRQILFLLPTNIDGVKVQPPMSLVALRSSWTTTVNCQGALIDDRLLLAGPSEKVLSGRKKGLPLGQAFLAMGLCRGALDLIQQHRSPGAGKAFERLSERLDVLRSEILELSQEGREAEAVEAGARLRGSVNDLALRITHAAVTLYKGTALLAGHPAQRLAREALFLLVWSCPNPVIDCTVDLLSDICYDD